MLGPYMALKVAWVCENFITVFAVVAFSRIVGYLMANKVGSPLKASGAFFTFELSFHRVMLHMVISVMKTCAVFVRSTVEVRIVVLNLLGLFSAGHHLVTFQIHSAAENFITLGAFVTQILIQFGMERCQSRMMFDVLLWVETVICVK